MANQGAELQFYCVRVCASNRDTYEQLCEAPSGIEAAKQGLILWAELSRATLDGLTIKDGRVTAQAHAAPGRLFYGGRDYVDVSSRVID